MNECCSSFVPIEYLDIRIKRENKHIATRSPPFWQAFCKSSTYCLISISKQKTIDVEKYLFPPVMINDQSFREDILTIEIGTLLVSLRYSHLNIQYILDNPRDGECKQQKDPICHHIRTSGLLDRMHGFPLESSRLANVPCLLIKASIEVYWVQHDDKSRNWDLS